jgi:hypothetical protein
MTETPCLSRTSASARVIPRERGPLLHLHPLDEVVRVGERRPYLVVGDGLEVRTFEEGADDAGLLVGEFEEALRVFAGVLAHVEFAPSRVVNQYDNLAPTRRVRELLSDAR